METLYSITIYIYICYACCLGDTPFGLQCSTLFVSQGHVRQVFAASYFFRFIKRAHGLTSNIYDLLARCVAFFHCTANHVRHDRTPATHRITPS